MPQVDVYEKSRTVPVIGKGRYRRRESMLVSPSEVVSFLGFGITPAQKAADL